MPIVFLAAISGVGPIACYRRAVDDGGIIAGFLAGERCPFRGGGIGCRFRRTCLRHCRFRRERFHRILRPRQPHFLAAGAAHGTARRAQRGRIDRIGGCTMGANDVHGADLHNDILRMLQADR